MRSESRAVLGMVGSVLADAEVSLPITYELASDMLQPFADAISFDVGAGQRWR